MTYIPRRLCTFVRVVTDASVTKVYTGFIHGFFLSVNSRNIANEQVLEALLLRSQIKVPSDISSPIRERTVRRTWIPT